MFEIRKAVRKMLRAEDIVKSYSLGETTVHALKGVSLEVREKELIVILGPSGSGKSTMMNILGGIETPTSGTLYFRNDLISGRDDAFLSRYRREHVGFVFQFYNLLPGLTALENIALASELGKNPLNPEQLLREVGLEARASHFPAKLSGGEQQRIAIARALCKNPDLLLCDEPTGALDSKTGIQVLKCIHDFCRKYEKTVILITHNAGIAQIADRVFYFKDGILEKIKQNKIPLTPESVSW